MALEAASSAATWNTASAWLQCFTVMSPPLEGGKEEERKGKRRGTQYTVKKPEADTLHVFLLHVFLLLTPAPASDKQQQVTGIIRADSWKEAVKKKTRQVNWLL